MKNINSNWLGTPPEHWKALLEGDAVIDKYNDSQPEEEYIMMRKFGLILLQDIVDERDSLVKREFSKQLSNDDLLKIIMTARTLLQKA